MNKEDMKNKCAERAKIFQQAMKSCKSSNPIDCVEWFADRISELEEKIRVLLSCKNCPENKGGLICAKEYENKCLAQKIQFIKELQQENEELDCQKNRNKYCYSCANATERCFRNEVGCPCQKYKSYKDENEELKTKVTALENANRAMVKELDDTTSGGLNIIQNVVKNKEKLATAKEIISEYINILKGDTKNWKKTQEKAEQFLKDCEVEK